MKCTILECHFCGMIHTWYMIHEYIWFIPKFRLGFHLEFSTFPHIIGIFTLVGVQGGPWARYHLVLWCFPDFNDTLNLHKTHKPTHTSTHQDTATNIFFCKFCLLTWTLSTFPIDISAGKRNGRWTKDSQNTFYQFSHFPPNKEPLKQN